MTELSPSRRPLPILLLTIFGRANVAYIQPPLLIGNLLDVIKVTIHTKMSCVLSEMTGSIFGEIHKTCSCESACPEPDLAQEVNGINGTVTPHLWGHYLVCLLVFWSLKIISEFSLAEGTAHSFLDLEWGYKLLSVDWEESWRNNNSWLINLHVSVVNINARLGISPSQSPPNPLQSKLYRSKANFLTQPTNQPTNTHWPSKWPSWANTSLLPSCAQKNSCPLSTQLQT